MRDSTTTKDVHSLGDGEGVENHQFIPEAAERLDNNVPREVITRRATQLATNAGLVDDTETLKRGAWLAHDPVNFYKADASEDEKQVCSSISNKLKVTISHCLTHAGSSLRGSQPVQAALCHLVG
jgi:hypothetical protein